MPKAATESLDEEFLTTRQLAKKLSLNPQYVRDIARLGLIPSKRVGSNWRFSLKEVDRQMKRNAAQAVERSLSTTSTDE